LHAYAHVVPPVQVAVALAGAGHMPHAAPVPQLVGSLLTAHDALLPVPHRCSLGLQANPHPFAAEQVAVPPATAAHWLPQVWQFFGSVCMFTQALLHRDSPVAQPDVQAKVPPEGEQYGNPVGQVVVQLPQWAGALMTVSHPLSGSVVQIP
jgi:hypothetical protein